MVKETSGHKRFSNLSLLRATVRSNAVVASMAMFSIKAKHLVGTIQIPFIGIGTSDMHMMVTCT